MTTSPADTYQTQDDEDIGPLIDVDLRPVDPLKLERAYARKLASDKQKTKKKKNTPTEETKTKEDGSRGNRFLLCCCCCGK